MMNRKTALFGAVIAIAAGLFGANAAQINTQSAITNSLAEGSPIYGHVTLVAKDSQGHVTAYRQTDNLILNQGLNCIGPALFRTVNTIVALSIDVDTCGGTGATNRAVSAVFPSASGFRWIHIGTDSTPPDASQAGLLGEIVGATGSAIRSASPTVTPVGTGTTGIASGIGPVVVISITNLGVTYTDTSIPVREAGLMDRSATASENVLSRVTFAPVGMTAGDTLTVTWSITLSHS